MAKNISLMGASYSDVPTVVLPQTGGGTASFTDVTDTTATASDVSSGKYFYTSAGVRTLGTGTGTGMSDDVKTALLNCFEHVAWIDDQGQTYYDELYNALYGGLVSISAVYTQTTTVYTTDSLDVLRSDLVVTATYGDGTTRTVTGYTLSGTLTEGTSVITAEYQGLTDTFNVTGVVDPIMYEVTNRSIAQGETFYSSGFSLLSTDDDFTLAVDFDKASSSSDTAQTQIFGLMKNETGYPGICFRREVTSGVVQNPMMLFKWMSVANTDYKFPAADYVGRIRIVLTHKKNSGSATYTWKFGSGTQQTQTIQSSFVSFPGNMQFGAGGANITIGTFNKVLIESRTWDSDKISAFMA